VTDLSFELGSRSGSWFTVALFGTMLAAFGFAISRAIRQVGGPGWRVAAIGTGWLFFLAPLWLVWFTSLGGFYEAELAGGRLRLRYLSGLTSEMAAADVSSIRAMPAFKGRWRLRIVDRGGREFESATWHREPVDDAATSLSRVLNLTKQ
jgi:hypothetical protein